MWYDGYHFGDVDVYCPWDVMNYVLDLQRKPDAKPLSYWKNTSDNAIIRSFIDYAGSSITQKLETLLSGGYIVLQVHDELLIETKKEEIEEVSRILEEEMKGAADLAVELDVDMHQGDSWYEAK